MSKITTRKFHDFIILPAWLYCRTTRDISDSAKLLYSRFIRYMGDNNVCWPSIESMAKELGKNTRQIDRLLSELKKLKLIKSTRVGKKCNNRYVLPHHKWMEEDMHSDTSQTTDHMHSDTSSTSDPMDTSSTSDPYKEYQVNKTRERALSVDKFKNEKTIQLCSSKNLNIEKELEKFKNHYQPTAQTPGRFTNWLINAKTEKTTEKQLTQSERNRKRVEDVMYQRNMSRSEAIEYVHKMGYSHA